MRWWMDGLAARNAAGVDEAKAWREGEALYVVVGGAVFILEKVMLNNLCIE